METPNKYILSVNSGSSSLKLAAFQPHDHSNPVARIQIDNIGSSYASVARLSPSGETSNSLYALPTHIDALRVAIGWLEEVLGEKPFIAIGYRVVHGGPKHRLAEAINKRTFDDLKEFAPFDPDHLPDTLKIISKLGERYPSILHVACYDSAFFKDLPSKARRLPLPRAFDALGVERYGFHGLSYTYLLAALTEKQGGKLKSDKVIMAHLGSGSSLMALQEGVPVDTTMSFSPTSGIMTSTRSGDIDPSLLFYLHRKGGMSLSLISDMLNKEAGLKGVSGLTGDMETLLREASSHKHAKEAIELYCYQVTKAIGAYAAAMGGVDALVFAGGIGEKSAPVRKMICEQLAFLGIVLDQKANKKNSVVLSKRRATVKIYAFTTDESQVIASVVRQELSARGVNYA